MNCPPSSSNPITVPSPIWFLPPEEEQHWAIALFLKHGRAEKDTTTMQLIYRGIKHETTIPTVATTEGKVIGKYRGLPLHQQVSVNH